MAKMAVMQERTKAQWAEESAIDAKIREATEAAQDLAPNSEGYEAAFHTLNALKTQKSDMQKASVVALSAPPTAEELAAVQSTAASM
ncbi:hypothetical protein A3767_17220 [Oleiphilus sp. HI0133]|nr:hypothetical protein A3767_17220 [Oleiphilus sp. HI0133]